MPEAPRLNPFQRLKVLILGNALNPADRKAFHSISLIAFFAWVGLGADGLSSSSYGPENAFLTLKAHPHLGIFVALATIITIFVISASYSQIIELFPTGGGGYLVASKLLNPTMGMICGCALLIDYVLTLTISIAAGADAIFSFLPPDWYRYKLEATVLGIVLLSVLNLRGAKESIMVLLPVFIVFLVTHAFIILYSLFMHAGDIPALIQSTARDTRQSVSEMGMVGMFLLIMRSYSMGGSTYTGIEAVSNGLPILREPKVQTGKRTMIYMSVSLAFTVFGLMVAYLLYDVSPEPGKTLNAVLFEKATAAWGGKAGTLFVQISLFSEAAILFAAAQAGFMGGPRVLANMSLDHWYPTKFTLLSDRLVSQNGIILMGAAAVVMVALSGGSVEFLSVLYIITVFITFVLSQLGMVRHWAATRRKEDLWKRKLAVNGLGLVLCIFILGAVTFLKFKEGGWLALVTTGVLVAIALFVKRHYGNTAKMLKRMDNLVQAAQSSHTGAISKIVKREALKPEDPVPEPKFDSKARTAVMLVNGFNGIGLHTLFSIIRLFGGIYKNFVFVEIGLIDAGLYKGSDEVDNLQAHVRKELDGYVEFIRRHGYYGEGVSALSHDVVEGSAGLAPKIMERFPQSVFFMGQLVFPEESFLSRLFHNNVVFAVQRRLYHLGIPFIIMPVRVKMRV
ncbi:MAG TPA: APC family permease [Fibrobacteria bacterium]|nr:APC family permease [Fibrobacteria bacterium]